MLVNRSVLLVRPAEPYIEWATALHPRAARSLGKVATAYLVPECDGGASERKVLQVVFPLIFQLELDAWDTDEEKWPDIRSFATFKRWFHVEFHEVVMDICDYDLVRDDTVP